MRRRWFPVLLTPLLLLLGAAPAAAHDVAEHNGSKRVASDLRSRVVSSDLPPGVGLEVLANGESLELSNDGGVAVTVLRADGSPRLTIAPGDTARWHEDTAHPDSSDVDEDDPVAGWRVGLRIDEQAHSVNGEIRWSEGPSPIGWILLALGVAGIVGGIAWRTRRNLLGVALALGGAVATSMTHSISAFAAREPAGSRWDVVGDYLPVAGCWLLGIVAAALLIRGNRDGAWLAVLAAAGLALVTASGDAEVLWSSTLVVSLPDGVDRVVVATLLGTVAGTLVAVPIAMRRVQAGAAGQNPRFP